MPSKKATTNGNTAENEFAMVEIRPSRNSKEKNQKNVIKKEIAQQLAGDFNARELLRVLTEVKNGNFSVRMPIDQVGINGKICDALNEVISMNERMMEEFTKA